MRTASLYTSRLTPVAELHGILAQLLCNLVSSRGGAESEALADGALSTWLSGRREDDVLIRLLDSKDVRANTGVLRLLINLATPARQCVPLPALPFSRLIPDLASSLLPRSTGSPAS